ncbi:hypothetical protein [Thioalkalivibrio sp. ALE19]|uniref:hypothetical protein n=1 Tax=Thioalkalivibrio sp. ALE19 TaxID=1266909 RepID=UPI000418D38E|nr:hypothetical protein [Thioalkalivibrio sp. ALE19]
MARDKQKPEARPIETSPGEMATRYEHPAYGVVQVSRSSGNSRLFGSSLKHQHTIRLSIHRACLDRHLSSDFIHARDNRGLVEIEMSQTQWAQVVSSVGLGSGTPVTLRQVPDEEASVKVTPDIEEPDETADRQHARELREKTEQALAEAKERIAELEALANTSGSIPKKPFREAVRKAKFAVGNAPENVAFVHDRFTETMEDAKEAAKTEIEGHIHALTLQTGLEHLREEGARLLEDHRQGGEDDPDE